MTLYGITKSVQKVCSALALYLEYQALPHIRIFGTSSKVLKHGGKKNSLVQMQTKLGLNGDDICDNIIKVPTVIFYMSSISVSSS